MSGDTVTQDSVRGVVDAEGRLVEADPALAALQAQAGGRPGGVLAVPQIATLARLARRLGIAISRPALAASGDHDIDLWVKAEPRDGAVSLEISGWIPRPPVGALDAGSGEREADFNRAAAEWTWETDETLALTALSPAAAAALGRTPGDLVGRRLVHLFRFRESEDGTIPILLALAEQGPFAGQAAELIAAPGQRYELSGVPLIDGMGRFAGFRGTATRGDTAQEPEPEAEEAPAAAAALPPVVDDGAFSQRLDEALRSPLNHIVNAAELLRAQTDGPLRRDYSAYAGDIATAGRHLLAMVDDLVDLQAIERTDYHPDLEVIDLADIARRAAGLMSVRASARRVRIDKPADDERVLARGEFRRVLQIMMNLLTNAIRYTPEGAPVWLRCDEEADGKVSVTVADLGHGISAEDQLRIFEKFERLDPNEPGGTGLGLYIARRLARVMGGDLTVDSAPGQGARFTLSLPAAGQAPPAA